MGDPRRDVSTMPTEISGIISMGSRMFSAGKVSLFMGKLMLKQEKALFFA